MKQSDKLKAWMEEKGFSYTTLAQELGFSDTYIFKMATGTKPIGSGFMLKFLLHFGHEEASRIFEVPQPVNTELVTTP